MDWFKKPRGHEEDRASFPNQFPHKVSIIHQLNLPKREERGERDTGVAAWEKEQFTDELQKPHSPNTSEGVFIPAETGQIGSMDRTDRLVRPVRPVPGTGQTSWSAVSPYTRSHMTAEVLSSERSLLHDAAILMKIWSMVLEGP